MKTTTKMREWQRLPQIPVAHHDILPGTNPASRHDPNLAWFREARLGMFIHFGLWAGVTRTEHGQYGYGDRYLEYEALAKTWNPSALDVEQWMDVAQSAGCRYIMFVAKHLDGFCLWNTATSDFKVTHTPFKRDLLREVSEAARRRGLRICVYCIQNDWRSPYMVNLPGNYTDRYWKRHDDQPDWDRHMEYVKAQITEIFTQYGRIDGVWFDAHNKSEKHWRGRELYALIKKLQPTAVVNDRAGYGDYLGPECEPEWMEDYDPDEFNIELCDLTFDGWGWHKDAVPYSVPSRVDLLARCAGSGANLLINVGPDPSGRIPEEQADVMAGIGDWMRTRGEAVYGTESCRLDGQGDALRASRKGNDVFVFLRRYPDRSVVSIPGVKALPKTACLVGGPSLSCQMKNGVLEVGGLPVRPKDELTQVIKLSFTGEPVVVKPRRPVRREVVAPIATDQATILPAAWANLTGRSRKGYRHAVRELDPPDVGLDKLPAEFKAYGAEGRQAVTQWRAYQQQAIWHVETQGALRARVRLCVRVPELMAGSRFEIRCGTNVLQGQLPGQPMPTEWTPTPPDWFRGFHFLPFAWEDVGELDLPAGRSDIVMNPTWIPYGNIFCDVLGMEICPISVGRSV
jgi:alpha-L-fucosidase